MFFAFVRRGGKNKYNVLRGKIVIPMSYAKRKIPYKYVVGDGRNVEFEELVEFGHGYVNRCLVIPDGVGENGRHQCADNFALG